MYHCTILFTLLNSKFYRLHTISALTEPIMRVGSEYQAEIPGLASQGRLYLLACVLYNVGVLGLFFYNVYTCTN